LNIHM